jgi:hypothetical protein
METVLRHIMSVLAHVATWCGDPRGFGSWRDGSGCEASATLSNHACCDSIIVATTSRWWWLTSVTSMLWACGLGWGIWRNPCLATLMLTMRTLVGVMDLGGGIVMYPHPIPISTLGFFS